MKFNQEIAICSSGVILVPYSAHHVSQYHKWMSSAKLRALTASDELTLEEEFANQQCWREDGGKLTFISIDSAGWHQRSEAGETSFEEHSGQEELCARLDDCESAMRGDVNMFFHEDEENENHVVGELNIMVADTSSRGKGFGKRVLFMFLWYVMVYRLGLMTEYKGFAMGRKPDLSAFVAKIDHENKVSIRMFETIGFRRLKEEPNFFGEIELRLEVDSAQQKLENYFKNSELMLLRYKLQAEE